MTDVREWWAPGRASVLGEHLDYNGGETLACAVDRGVRLKARLRDDHLVRAWTEFGGRQSAEFALGATRDDVDGWIAYVAGVVAGLVDRGLDRGVDLVYSSDLPTGAGLSSSAAFGTATATALNDLAGIGADDASLASIVQAAENDFAGAPTGLLDPLTILGGEPDALVHLDFAHSPPASRAIAARWADDGLELVAVDTRSRRSLSDGRYGERRDECERASTEGGLDRLCAIGLASVVTLSDETLKARARHAFTEQARVRAALPAIADGDWAKIGTLLDASHASLADDFAVSSAPLDHTCELARDAGALGAKLSGGGFAGSVIVLIERDRITGLREALEKRYSALGWDRPLVFSAQPSAGSREITSTPGR